MARRSDSSLAAVLLTQRLVDVGVPSLKAAEYWRLLEVIGDPAELLAATEPPMAIDPDLAARLRVLLGAASSLAFALDEAEQSGLRLVASVDDDYPTVLLARLGRAAPPLLYLVGDPALLRTPSLGIAGSRDASDAAIEVAERAAEAAVAAGWGVVSGGSRGPERSATMAAVARGGVAVEVLADPLWQATRDRDVRRGVTAGRLCVCTPYPPSAPFTAARAEGRTKIVDALAKAVLVVSARHETGATWAGAVDALRRSTVPVLVWCGDGAGEGNEALLAKGASAVEAVDDVVTVASAAAGRTAAEEPAAGT